MQVEALDRLELAVLAAGGEVKLGEMRKEFDALLISEFKAAPGAQASSPRGRQLQALL